MQLGNTGCLEDDEQTPELINKETPQETSDPGVYTLPYLEEPYHYPGIAVYTADMSKNRSTELNSEWVIRHSQYVGVSSEILRNGYNAMHKISFERIQNSSDYVEFVMAIHGKLVKRTPLPNAFLDGLTGVSFRAVSYSVPINLTVGVYNIDGVLLQSENFKVTTNQMQTFQMAFNNQELHHIAFKISGERQDLSAFSEGALGIDDIYLTNNNTEPFQPPLDDTNFLDWLKTCSINYFLWNYRDADDGQGVVIEASDESDKVSLSGIGYAYAIYILAEKENIISPSVARRRILAMLRWQEAQNWRNGSEGIFGFPFHYFDSKGNGLYEFSAEAVSTIDWAICAAGLRTVRQKYATDNEIVSICNELLNRPQWKETVHNNLNDNYRFGRISKGLSSNGTKNGQVWADAFSEETEIVYLEALASGQINDLDLDKIYREYKNGYYVSWFGSGFTYNWMQLWTGMVEPYQSNSKAAYRVEANTVTSNFGKLLMGLTACGTASEVENNGFISWDRYIGNQGASTSGADESEVIQISPAPYGAALALPFMTSEAIQSLRNYVSLGYYHPLLGLPDNIRIAELPGNLDVPVPNWNPYDINVGPMAMAIEQYQENTISRYYMKDVAIENSLQKLIKSF